MKDIRVATYARVSTTEQAEEGYSIDAQVEIIENRCKAEGKTVVGVYSDRGISGKSMVNRLELQRLLEDCKKGLFDEVIVWKTSRLARNIIDLLQIVKELEANNVSFRSMTEPYDTSTPTGKLMMSVLASFGEFERTTILENLKLGMNARARQGLKNGGKLLGYRSVGSGKDSRLESVPEESELVKKIFDLYASGMGYKAIANKLNKEGYRSIKGNLFGIAGIKEIISNPTYVGKIRFNNMVDWSNKRRSGKNDNFIFVDGLHEAIITEEIWNKVQEIKSVRADKYPRTYSGDFPLTGLLRCPECGAGMVAARTVNTLKDGTKKRIRYYSCGRFRNQGSSACKANSVRADEAEQYVFDKIQKILVNEKVLKDVVDTINQGRQDNIKPLELEKTSIERQIEAYLERKKKVFDLYEVSGLRKEDLTERLMEIETKIDELVTRKDAVINDMSYNGTDEIPFEVVRGLMGDFHRLLMNADKEHRKLFLQLVVNKITVGNNRKIDTIEIHFNHTLRGIIKSFLGEESSDDEDSSPLFVFSWAI